jgi:serine/threonine protein kinase
MPDPDLPLDARLLERLQRALGDRYELQHLLGAGGMGVVYLARDLTLDRPIAVKVVPPHLATAVAVERFLREAQILADLNHPNIVKVYDFGQREGLLYYLMEYLQGETLAARIQRARLPSADAVAMAPELLAALETAHERGIVHRDVKPSNVMLVGTRPVLTDFGIAKRATRRDETVTEPDAVPGTPAYMAPEAIGGEVTELADQYSAAMVIYEALTARQWEGVGAPERADWSGVPRHLYGPLARALASAPADRWPDVASLRHALLRARPPRPLWVRAAAAVAAVVALAAVVWVNSRAQPEFADGPSQLRLHVPRLGYDGPPAGAWIADSITAHVRRSLAGPDVTVLPREGRRAGASTIAGTLTMSGDSVAVTLIADALSLPRISPRPEPEWRALADSAALQTWIWIWRSRAERGPLPVRALPATPDAFPPFVHGELLFAQARWREAARAYAQAEALDSTCLLCSWRLFDVGRWLSLTPDEARYRRLLANESAFPPHYRAVIRAAVAPTATRVDSLAAAVELARDFRTAWFHWAEELFHRGPLVRHSRRGAEAAYVQVTQLEPAFVPAWHHLAWLRTAEGDRSGAESALFHIQSAGDPADAYSLAFNGYVGVGFAWRFLPPDSARAFTESVLADPRIAEFEDLGAGARFLTAFDAPRGAIAVARLLRERDLTPLALRSTLLAEVFGNVALGRPDSARVAVARLQEQFDNPQVALFGAQLDAAWALFGSGTDVGSTIARLEEHVAPYPGAEERIRRAAYLLVLLERSTNRGDAAARHLALLASEPAPHPFTTLLDADSIARRGALARAIEISLNLVGSLDSSQTVDDPFFRTMHHVHRAAWYTELGNVEEAFRELGWFENADIAGGYPTDDPKNAEVDWAFGTEAQWRRAQLLDRAGRRTADACASYEAVSRHWIDGASLFAARADTARRRFRALGCGDA